MNTRMGDWNPTSMDERIDRLESIAELRQLVMRYAWHLDARNIDGMAELFEPNVTVGGDKKGREHVKEWFNTILRDPRVSIHHVENHVLNFDDADHANGVVYCTDELERPAIAEWHRGVLQYWDDYVRLDGRWFFSRRRLHRWYIDDVTRRPVNGANVGNEGFKPRQLPDVYPTWKAFWDAVPG